jgi:toxin ParE1/3/4
VKIQWTSSALNDLVDVRVTISQDRPEAASAIGQKILDAVDVILDFPDVGKAGRAAGTHELVVPSTPYILIYRRFKAKVQLLRVLHARRRWPPKHRRKR